MRENIYYWKCDSPHSLAEKRQAYFKEKYDRGDLAGAVQRACASVFGHPPGDIAPLRVDGNHIAFTVHDGDRTYFFRADDGAGEDDYMLAESRLMDLAADAGVPVPRVFHTDISRTACPLRFQLMERCPDRSLSVYDKDGTLNRDAVAPQLGRILKKLHAVQLNEFGFIDTGVLSRTSRVTGLDSRYRDYFNKRLDEHMDYVLQHGLLNREEGNAVLETFRRHAPRLDRDQGVLVHRDMAMWNLLGTPDRITAVIDWDDAVSGDPADDLGILRCFYDSPFMDLVFQGYADGAAPLDDDFHCRVWLHTLRNMLWKTMLRHALGYFDKGSDFFLNTRGIQLSLREHTLNKLREALEHAGRYDTP